MRYSSNVLVLLVVSVFHKFNIIRYQNSAISPDIGSFIYHKTET